LAVDCEADPKLFRGLHRFFFELADRICGAGDVVQEYVILEAFLEVFIAFLDVCEPL
jgi:hypothetical protein